MPAPASNAPAGRAGSCGAGVNDVPVRVQTDAGSEVRRDAVAEEVPLALLYNGEPHVVMMGTPADLEDFALGFSITEDIVAGVDEVAAIDVVALDAADVEAGFQIDVRIPASRQQALAARRRNLQGRTGCGLCGVQTVAEAVRAPRRVAAGLPITPQALRRALDALGRLQPINALTGATHAAAWATPDGLIAAVREDVGRHNALDKLIGHRLRQQQDFTRGFLIITSRASYEMVLKAAMVGVPIVVAISAPTAYAIRVAEDAGLTLVGFARGQRQVVYSCPARLLPAT